MSGLYSWRRVTTTWDRSASSAPTRSSLMRPLVTSPCSTTSGRHEGSTACAGARTATSWPPVVGSGVGRVRASRSLPPMARCWRSTCFPALAVRRTASSAARTSTSSTSPPSTAGSIGCRTRDAAGTWNHPRSGHISPRSARLWRATRLSLREGAGPLLPVSRQTLPGSSDGIASMTLRRLKLLAILAPLLFLAALELARQVVSPALFQGWPGQLLLAGIVLLGTLFFAEAIFGVVSRLQTQLAQQNQELLAL